MTKFLGAYAKNNCFSDTSDRIDLDFIEEKRPPPRLMKLGIRFYPAEL